MTACPANIDVVEVLKTLRGVVQLQTGSPRLEFGLTANPSSRTLPAVRLTVADNYLLTPL
jgi:hypothetical protein